MMNAIPVSTFMWPRRSVSASNPPAEAPIPTIGKMRAREGSFFWEARYRCLPLGRFSYPKNRRSACEWGVVLGTRFKPCALIFCERKTITI